MARSTVARTLDECRRLAWCCDITERWIPTTRFDPKLGKMALTPYGKRKDLYGFTDVLAIDASKNQFVFIQTTSGGNTAHRVEKILEECRAQAVEILKTGARIEVWEWRKYKKAVDRRHWRVLRTEILLPEVSERKATKSKRKEPKT